MSNPFQKATKHSARLRLALIGPAGSGKTYTSLTLAACLGGRVAVIDTERGSASKYADLFAFDVLELDTFHPRTYAESIAAAAKAGYAVVVVDSLSHAWVGKQGGLELHDLAVDRQTIKNTYTAWRDVTPHHNAMIDAIVQSPCHVIATMRSKTEYVQEKDERGKTTIRKVGLAPVQRDGLEYEFDVVGDMDQDNKLVITKSRCPRLSGGVFPKPGREVAELLVAWLDGPAAAPVSPTPQPAANGPKWPTSGPEFYERVKAFEGKLQTEGVCNLGELIKGLILWGHDHGLADRLADWPADKFQPAMEWCAKWAADRRKEMVPS